MIGYFCYYHPAHFSPMVSKLTLEAGGITPINVIKGGGYGVTNQVGVPLVLVQPLSFVLLGEHGAVAN